MKGAPSEATTPEEFWALPIGFTAPTATGPVGDVRTDLDGRRWWQVVGSDGRFSRVLQPPAEPQKGS